MGGQDASGDPAQQGHVLAARPGGQGKRASHHPKRAAGRSRYTRPVSRPSRSAPSPPPAPPAAAACTTTPAPAPTRGRSSGPGRAPATSSSSTSTTAAPTSPASSP